MKTLTRDEAIALVGSAARLPQYGYVILADGRRLYGLKNSRRPVSYWVQA